MRYAISIQQPWAWLIVNGFKDIENRDWPTKFRGRILIHAGKKIDHDAYQFLEEGFPMLHVPSKDTIACLTGGIVGEARIVDCVQESDSPWFFGKFGFVLEDQKVLPFAP